MCRLGQRPGHTLRPLPTRFLLPQPRLAPGCLWPVCVHAHMGAYAHTRAHGHTHAAEAPGDAVVGPTWPPLSSCLGGRSGLSRSLCGVGGALGPPSPPAQIPLAFWEARHAVCAERMFFIFLGGFSRPRSGTLLALRRKEKQA